MVTDRIACFSLLQRSPSKRKKMNTHSLPTRSHSRRLKPYLGEILVKNFGLETGQLEYALEKQLSMDTRLGDVCVSLGLSHEETIVKALGLQLGIPFLDHISLKTIHVGLVDRIPIAFAKHHKLIPLWEEGASVVIAVSDPFDYAAVDDLQILFNKPVRITLAPPSVVLQAINQVYEQTAHHHAVHAMEGIQEESLDHLAHQIEKPLDLLDTDDDAPIIRLVNSMIFQGAKQRASDIHVESYESELVVRYRIDGILYQILTLPARLQASIVSRIKILAGLDIAEKRLPQDGRFAVTIAGRSVDIRVSVIPTAHGERAVLRILEKNDTVLDLGEVGFSRELLKKVSQYLNLNHGIVLVTGPTGSGKTTTLYAALSRINGTERNILTIEDPVEYQLSGVGQIQVNPKIDLTFANGLRSILRQDPDVVMVGEIRDQETAEIAIHASLTGHLVFSTLHTNDSAGAITRLVDMGIEPFLIASSVVAVLAQRLLRRICSECRSSYKPNASELRQLRLPESKWGHVSVFYRGKGCSACLHTGYRGRTGIFELLTMNDDIRSKTVDHEDSTQIRQAAMANGMQTLWDEGVQRVLTGESTTEEVVRVLQHENMVLVSD